MKKTSLATMKYRLYSTFVVCIVLALALLAMFIHVQSLNSRISVLEDKATTTDRQLASYQRSLCSTIPKPIDVLTKYTVSSAGFDRTYHVHTPDNYDPSVRYPVIVSFDGIDGSGSRMEAYSGLDELPAVVVYPDSLPGKRGFTAWQGAPYSLEGTQDVQFVSDILKTLPSQYCVDSTRTFAVGMSNGGAFATIVGCELGSQIRAVASISGAYYQTCQQQQRTPSLLIVHSTTDGQAPFGGSVARRLPKVTQWTEKQAVERACATTLPVKTIGATSYYDWLNCTDDSMLRFIVIQNQAHGWLALPEASIQRAQGTAGYIWKFFEES